MAQFANSNANVMAVLEARPIHPTALALYEGEVDAALSHYTEAMTMTTLVLYHRELMTHARFGPSSQGQVHDCWFQPSLPSGTPVICRVMTIG